MLDDGFVTKNDLFRPWGATVNDPKSGGQHGQVLDLHSRGTLRGMTKQAFARWGIPEIVNTDQGSHFTATEVTDAVLGQGCKLSMDGRGAWRDNVFVERLWRCVKYERVYLKACDGVSAARADIADYVAWHDSSRAHSSLGDATPDEHDFAHLPTLAMAA